MDEWKKIEKENNDFLKQVKKFIVKYYGKRCGELASGCVVCEIYSVFDILQTHLFNRPHKK